MYENFMAKIENGEFENFKIALEKITNAYKMGLLTKQEFWDCKDYAIFNKSKLNKIKSNYIGMC